MPADGSDSGVGRQLHETYLKSKRYLVFFSGALLLSLVAGVDPKTDASVLPIKIARPEYWSLALGAVVLYYMAQLVIFWAAQTAPVRSVRPHVVDYWMSFTIGLVSLISVLAVQVVPLIPPLFDAVRSAIAGSPIALTSELTFGLVTFVASLLTVITTYVSVRRARRGIRSDAVEEATQSATVADVLTSYLWELVFNPVTYSQTNGRRGSKPMVFEAEGVISEGRNNNEDTWQVNGRFLELLDSSGSVFSRFKYNPELNRFDHTNDPDTKSIRNQYLFSKTKFTFEPDGQRKAN